ncbi:hypothetical protein [Streptomyces sp. cmx-4-9]|uniref:hypothetical protein n=1 Tax=Streptomyces sp. cmx-4-9 TaxID=2790941 RepID=UPI00397F0DAF
MRPGSAFLNSLNSGDETPGSPRYATWASPCDRTQRRHQRRPYRRREHHHRCLDHNGLRIDRTVYEQVKEHLG